MKKFGIRLAAAAVATALSLTACGAEEPKKEAAPAAEAPKAEAPAAEAPKAEAPKAEAPKAEAPAAAAPAPAAAAPEASPENAAVQAAAKDYGAEFKDGRFRDKDGKPQPVVTKDFKVDWATWEGFRRYHDACHVCHGPMAGGSTFAPSLAESLKTMDYETFYGVVVGGRIRESAGTKYVMPAFGTDKNIMCYIDDIYSYIKARSISLTSDGKQGMLAGRPTGRHDISPEARKRAADCIAAKE